MSNKEQVSVTIDSNEESQNIEVVEILVLHEDVEEINIEPLETGDFIIEDCIFERKTPSDFASSLMEGRLREQVERMAADDRNSFLLVEGDMSDFSSLSNTQMDPKSLRGMSASIIGRYGIPVVFCSEPKYLADMAIRIARKNIEEPSQRQISNSNVVEEVPYIVKFFASIDGIGIETAENLSYEFQSVKDALDASIDDLQRVDGVGPKYANKIHNTLHKGETKKSEDSNDVTVVRI